MFNHSLATKTFKSILFISILELFSPSCSLIIIIIIIAHFILKPAWQSIFGNRLREKEGIST